MNESLNGHRPRHRLGVLTLLGLIGYALSSGPVLATAFWLREATGFEAFYFVIWIYAPLLVLPRSVWDPYITWWVELFGTVGPG
jgi:hypothetical protein